MKSSWALSGILLSLLILAPNVRSETASSPEIDALKEKGLVKQGSLFVLTAEGELTAGMKELRQLKGKVDADAKVRHKYEDQVKMAKSAIAQIDFERRKLNEDYLKQSDPTIKNQDVAKINILSTNYDNAIEFKNTADTKLHGLGEETRTKYVNQLIDLAAKSEETQKKYEELAADDDVKGNIQKINETAKPKMKLGPSSEFKQIATQLKRLRTDVQSDIVPLVIENHVPTVEVTINGKVTRTMILDSGASEVCVPADLAKELELVPGPNDRTVRMQLADGKVVEGKEMMLKSVRVGTFTIENVECAVLPESLIAAQALLGGSFLNHFTYRLDADAGQLHLAQVGGAAKPVTGEKPKPDVKKPEGAAAEKDK